MIAGKHYLVHAKNATEHLILKHRCCSIEFTSKFTTLRRRITKQRKQTDSVSSKHKGHSILTWRVLCKYIPDSTHRESLSAGSTTRLRVH